MFGTIISFGAWGGWHLLTGVHGGGFFATKTE